MMIQICGRSRWLDHTAALKPETEKPLGVLPCGLAQTEMKKMFYILWIIFDFDRTTWWHIKSDLREGRKLRSTTDSAD